MRLQTIPDMDSSLFHQQDGRQSITLPARPAQHLNTDALIQPWANARGPLNKTLPIPRKERSRVAGRDSGQRKKTMDERIEEMYRKYSKEGISVNRDSARVNSREIYREMLRQFEKAQQFKQMGSKRQRSVLQTEAQQFSFDLLNKKINSCVCAYDYRQIRAGDSPPKHTYADLKCAGKFQRMMKIRDKIRKKNSLAVSKQKDKYLSDYRPGWPFSQREVEPEQPTQADREKARLKIRIKNQAQSKPNIVIDSSNAAEEFKVVGTYTNAFEYTINRSIIGSSNSMRGTKYRNRKLNSTYHSSRQ